jgi:hypothetical protein
MSARSKSSIFLLLSIYLIISAIFIINYGDRLETIEKLQYPIEKEEKKKSKNIKQSINIGTREVGVAHAW